MGTRFVGMVAALGVTLGGPVAAFAKQTYVYVHDRETGGGIYAWVLDKNGGLTSIAATSSGDLVVGTVSGDVIRIDENGGQSTIASTGDRLAGVTVLGDGIEVTAVPYSIRGARIIR